MKTTSLIPFLATVAGAVTLGAADTPPKSSNSAANLAVVAASTTSFVSGHETINALNDGFMPHNSGDKSHGAYGNWPQSGTQWVQYDWRQPISTNRIEVYWFDDDRGVRLPVACRLKYWDGSGLVPVPGAEGLGIAENTFNPTTFPEITTSRLRLEFDSNGTSSTGILDWRVIDSGKSPNFPPTVSAGVDRFVVGSAETFLTAFVHDDGKPAAAPTIVWRKSAGPGEVAFADAAAAATTARFSAPGEYTLELTANDGSASASASVHVTAVAAPPAAPLGFVWPRRWQVGSPFWRPRIKNQIVNWIPHCVAKINDPNTKEGNMENFVQSAKKLAGQPAQHTGPVFADAWAYNAFESMCLALMVDPEGDAEIAAAQAKMRAIIEDWIPKFLGAQAPDGYLHTMYTIQGIPRWSNKADHEGYLAGYFIEAAIAHCLLTEGRDTRMIDAARRLADRR